MCLGNICRSPMAEGIFRALCEEAGMQVHIDSAGTGSWHVGEPPDHRAIQCLKGYNIDISHLRARQVREMDFDTFNLILAMDYNNLRDLHRLMPSSSQVRARVHLFGEYTGLNPVEVPDPYYGTAADFEKVYHMLHRGMQNLIMRLRHG
ncbi:MAG: low molecular weight phosphotyrosine protein phosphatase [Flavobacteriales bacterium]|nr:low molecular weight phosphotyrosine protein phosphatase [Flavobacteriales bacterium]MDW8410108.1 low molecular weight protein-tyrosine-phosphatase [Flavobacteriales bacterium]